MPSAKSTSKKTAKTPAKKTVKGTVAKTAVTTPAPKKTQQLLAVCQIIFPFTIKAQELAGFRGAALDAVKKNQKKFAAAGMATDLFHNHDEAAPGRRFIRPPAVVYQLQRGDAAMPGDYYFPAVTGYGQGAEAVQLLAGCLPAILTVYQRPFSTRGSEVRQSVHPVAVQPQLMEYGLQRWLALNPDNYTRYKKDARFTQRVQLLEEILHKNIVGWYRALGIHIEEKKLQLFITEIKSISHNGPELNGRNMFVFDGCFATNLQLPEQMTIGNGGARGFGVIKPLHRVVAAL